MHSRQTIQFPEGRIRVDLHGKFPGGRAGKNQMRKATMETTIKRMQQMRSWGRWSKLLWLIVFALGIPTLVAQVDQGAVTGVVTDISGAAIPNAKVSLTSIDTGFIQDLSTN